MTVVLPTSLEAALAALADRPDAHLLAGGTDFMVEVNAGHRRPDDIVVLTRVPELRAWSRHNGTVRLGAGVTYRDLLDSELADLSPGLAQASRTVGSPQIRNAGTIGGNVATASPAGDTLPVLAALDAVVELAHIDATRELSLADFLTGPKRNALRPGEIITAVRIPVAAGPQEYLKVGVRNAMVIAVASVALCVDREQRTVKVGLGSVGPTPLRAPEAEALTDGRPLSDVDPAHFGELVAAAAVPIDDHRSTAVYRRHAVKVMASRALARAAAA